MFSFFEYKLKRYERELDGDVCQDPLKAFTVLLGILDEFDASKTWSRVVVMLLVVTGRLISLQAFFKISCNGFVAVFRTVKIWRFV